MEAKILNLAEALRLYAIIGKPLKETGAAHSALVSLRPDEFIQCAEVVLGMTKEELDKEDTWRVLEETIKGINQNRIPELASVVEYFGVK